MREPCLIFFGLTELAECKHRFCLMWMHVCAAKETGQCGKGHQGDGAETVTNKWPLLLQARKYGDG